ncbi:MAG: cell division protein FtsA [Candidatus Moraniibacteriota bacterium]|nr:MAG: cell division protein FtsA [Candidatus Moranbacteria bacterium]
MKGNIITSIDLGSSVVRCVIADVAQEDGQVRVLGVGIVPAEGMRRGAVVDIGDAADSIAAAVEKAEQMSGEHVKNAIVSIGGAGITVNETQGVIAIGRADGEVIEDDVVRVIEAAQAISIPTNNDIIHVIPRSFRLDDQRDIKDPVGLRGVRLEVDAVIVEAPNNHVKNLTAAMERADVLIDDFIIEPLAAAESTLTKKQKELGVALVNLGASTTSIAVYEEGELMHTAVLPVGSDFITNDIAIGLRTEIDIAERVKFEYGSADMESIDKKSIVDLSHIDERETEGVYHHHILEIINARLDEIFDLVVKELEKIGKDQLLPAGAVLTGGGAHMPHIVEFAKEKLRLPVSIGQPANLLGVVDHVDDSSYATVIGLVLWAMHGIDGGGTSFGSGAISGFSNGVGSIFDKTKKTFGRFLP